MFISQTHDLHWSEVLKNIAQTIAVLAAAGFFAWKIIAGYFFPALTIELRTKRHQQTPEHTDLLITATLTAAQIGAIWIHDIRARVTERNTTVEPLVHVVPLLGLQRLSTPRKAGRYIVDFAAPARKPLIAMSPQESTSFAAVLPINTDSICEIELVVAGRGRFQFVSQWHSSAVSAPNVAPTE